MNRRCRVPLAGQGNPKAGATVVREMRVSIVVPCWRDGCALVRLLTRLADLPEIQWIPVLAEPDDATVAALCRLGVSTLLSPRPSRGAQMNLGARRAAGEVLLFQHADAELLPCHLQALRRCLDERPEVIGGAFYRRFDERHPHLRWAERVERWHCRAFGTLYGDQSVFVRAGVFQALGGFAETPLMEDVDFSRRLRRRGAIAVLDPPMRSSPRKHLEEGPWRTTARNALLLALFRAGVPPEKLHAWYYAARRNSPQAQMANS